MRAAARRVWATGRAAQGKLERFLVVLGWFRVVSVFFFWCL